VSFGYDDNGNQIARGDDDFEYDHENRLTKLTPSGSEGLDPCYDTQPLPNGNGVIQIDDVNAVVGRFGASEGDPNYDPYYDIRPLPDGNDGYIGVDDVSAAAGQFGEVCLSSYVYNGDGLRTRGEGNRGLTWDYVWDVGAGLPLPLRTSRGSSRSYLEAWPKCLRAAVHKSCGFE
jgi:hypothetical protein